MGGSMSSKPQATIARLCAACAFSALTLAWSHARADDTTNPLLDLLKPKDAISQSEYDHIKTRQQSEAKDTAQKLQRAATRPREAEPMSLDAKAQDPEAAANAKAGSAASEAALAQPNGHPL